MTGYPHMIFVHSTMMTPDNIGVWVCVVAVLLILLNETVLPTDIVIRDREERRKTIEAVIMSVFTVALISVPIKTMRLKLSAVLMLVTAVVIKTVLMQVMLIVLMIIMIMIKVMVTITVK